MGKKNGMNVSEVRISEFELGSVNDGRPEFEPQSYQVNKLLDRKTVGVVAGSLVMICLLVSVIALWVTGGGR